MSLPKKTLGQTGLKVTQLSYGAMEIRGNRIWGGRPCTPEQADIILNTVVDAGINFIDTANDYGTSELFIGRFLADRRDEYYLATKCGCTVVFAGDHDETPHVWTRDNIMRNIADSLQKMQTDAVDILQLHNPDAQTAKDNNLVGILNELKDSGVVKHIGCSSTSPHLKTYIDWNVFDVFQIPYSALERQHENLITKAAEGGAGIIIRGGVARGEPGSGLGNQDRWKVYEDARLDELREEGESRTAFLLRFTLSHPYCHTTIVGTMNAEHLRENVEIANKGALPADVYKEAKKRLDEVGQSPE